MLNKIDVSWLKPDESTRKFHINGCVNRQNSRIWGSEKSHDVL